MSWLQSLYSLLSVLPPKPNQSTGFKKRKKWKQQGQRNPSFHPFQKPKKKTWQPSSHSYNLNKRPGSNQGTSLIAFHGTPSVANAQSILKDGWMVGNGNAYGDGIYFAADAQTAKSYSGSGGLYLKCRLMAKRICQWNDAIQNQYNAWCKKKGVAVNNSAKTAFLIQHGYDCVCSGNIIVMLAPLYANPTAWKRKNRKIKILSIHRSSNDQPIHI